VAENGLRSEKNRRRRNFYFAVAAACGLACGIGSLFCAHVYSQQMAGDRQWAEYDRTLGMSIQMAIVRLDRVEFYSRLYLSTHEVAYTATAYTAAANLQSMAERISKLEQNNAAEKNDAKQLSASAEALSTAVGRLQAQPEMPEAELLNARRSITDLTDNELSVLVAHTKSVNDKTLQSFEASVGLLLLMLAIGATMAAYLLRQWRQQGEREEMVAIESSQLRETIRVFERRVKESTVVTIVHDELQLCATLEDAFAASVRYMGKTFPGTRGALGIINNSRQMVETMARWSDGEIGTVTPASQVFALESCCGLRLGHTRWRKPGVSEVQCSHFIGEPSETYLCKPLAAQGDTLGVMIMECLTPEAVAHVEANMDLLRSITELSAMSIASLQLRSRLQDQSIRDSLTNLFNRHFMEVALDREIQRAKVHANTLAVLMIDVDHFKQFNDLHGHEAGDAVLRSVAETFRNCVRDEDIVCRYGGEEFLIILPEISSEAAFEKADMLRERVKKERLRHGGETLREITISVGVSMYPNDGDVLDHLVRAADQRLYAAKRQGRNRVISIDSRTA
jgi:diguanylate cyclase (GGDEF)-like protein